MFSFLFFPRPLKTLTYVGEGEESGADIMLKFWKELADLRPLLAEKFRGVFEDVSKCEITEEEEEAFQKELFCYGCQAPFDIEGEEGDPSDEKMSRPRKIKCKDHSHITNRYRGAACQQCNMKMDPQRVICDVFAHNMTNFDGAYILRSIPPFLNEHSILGSGGTKFKSLKVSGKPLKNQHNTSREFIRKKNPNTTDDESEEEDEDIEEEGTGSTEKKTTHDDGDVRGEDYVVFDFKDSNAFQTGTLSSLASRLTKAKKDLSILRQCNLVQDSKGKFNQDLFNLAQTKASFPYEAITGLNVLERREPPTEEMFHSSLGIGSDIDREEYNTFLYTWRVLQKEKYGDSMKLRDYLAFYNELDTILLAEIHDSFRRLAKKEYGVSTDWFMTLPAYAYTALLRMLSVSGEEVEQISDPEIYRFVQRSIRGGLCQILGSRLHLAPGAEDLLRELETPFTEYLKEGGVLDEDDDTSTPISEQTGPHLPNKRESVEQFLEERSLPKISTSEELDLEGKGAGMEILYLDANNLYGGAQTEAMPIGGYKFLYPPDTNHEKLVDYFQTEAEVVRDPNSNKEDAPRWEEYFDESEGFFIECDIEIPLEFHDRLKHLPPAPTHTTVETKDLPDHIQELYKERFGEASSSMKSEKLIASLTDKKDQVLHHSTACMYARIGATIKVKRALQFVQKTVLKQWVDKATEGRKQAGLAGDDLLVALYKLIINSVFGKFIENVENRSETKIITFVEDQLNALVSPFLKNVTILDDNHLLVTSYKKITRLDRQIAIGATILERSKAQMYGFLYDVLYPHFGGPEGCQPMYMDTDSFVLKVWTRDPEEEMKELSAVVDTSNYRKDHPLYNKKNAKELYYFKNECAESRPLIFGALKAKSYFILTEQSLVDIRRKKDALRKLGIRNTSSAYTDLKNSFVKNKGVIRAMTKELGAIQYLSVLYSACTISANFRKFQNVAGLPHLVHISKVALSGLDDKSQTLDCGLCTRVHGHWDTDTKCKIKH